MPNVEFLHAAKGLKDPKYCSYIERRGIIEQCLTSRRIFSEEHKARGPPSLGVLEEGDTSINKLPITKHDCSGKGHVRLASHHEEKTKGTMENVPKAEPDLDPMARKVQNLFESGTFAIRWILI